MNEAEVSGLLDAHDALVAAHVDGTLSFDEFVMAYGEFPGGYGLEDGAAADTRTIMRLFRNRIDFHRQVAGVPSGFRQPVEHGMPDHEEGFLRKAVLLRMRQLLMRYPGFKAVAPAVRDLPSGNTTR